MVLAATSAAVALLCAGQAAAQDRWTGWGADVFVGNSTEASSSDDGYFTDIEPTGSVYGLGASYRFPLGHLVVGVEASATMGSIKDSDTLVTCTVRDCGYNEQVTYTVNSSYSGRFGVSVGHEFGPVLVSALAGIEVRDRGIYTEVESDDPDSEDYFYDQTWIAAGPYFGVRAEYALTDRISIGGEWTRSDVVQSTIEFDGDESYEDSAEFNQARISLRLRF
ncbi:MAG: outer membrane protein beta-barrel domain [Patescibacteria group bacterium]|nr:outer membrane protein beta-barrel domain [Patescibacteria group bacterium]